jgi:hypothetical protein
MYYLYYGCDMFASISATWISTLRTSFSQLRNGGTFDWAYRHGVRPLYNHRDESAAQLTNMMPTETEAHADT